MPTNHTPSTTTLPDGAALSTLVDGDPVNRDNLYVEASPGSKLTLGKLHDMVTTLWTLGGSIKVAAYTGTVWTIAAGTLETFLHSLADKAAKLDATFQTFTGGATVNGAVQVGSLISLGATSLQGASVFSGKTSITGRSVPRSARVPVADAASKRIGVAAGTSIDYAGKRIALPAIPSTNPNVIIVDHTNAVPTEGETIEVLWTKASGGTNGLLFELRREDASVIASFSGSVDVASITACAELEFVSGVWRLGANSGLGFDSFDAAFGVVPGASA